MKYYIRGKDTCGNCAFYSTQTSLHDSYSEGWSRRPEIEFASRFEAVQTLEKIKSWWSKNKSTCDWNIEDVAIITSDDLMIEEIIK